MSLSIMEIVGILCFAGSLILFLFVVLADIFADRKSASVTNDKKLLDDLWWIFFGKH